jgi:D-sedoheptulose 7-phosphate isomerase
MSYITDYLTGLKGLINQIPEDGVEGLALALEEAWTQNRRVLVMGNGGSSSTASHIVNDLQKCIQMECGRALKVMCLSDCTPLIMAWANDTEYANIFAPQVECWAEPGDLVIAISGSGNSPNVLNGVAVARTKGVRVFGLIGYAGGKLAGMCDECIVVRSDNMQQIEDIHMVILHLVFSLLRDKTATDSRKS